MLIVVVSHAGYGDTIPGGLGVTVFFFLSGYLITTLILDEHRGTGDINVRNFYLRRAFRLFPPLFITLFIAYALVGAGVLEGGFSWQGLGSQVFYFANYFTIFFDDGTMTAEGTGILWSLAVEEHFYIIFPALMFAVMRFAHARRFLIGLFISLCVVALIWRSWLVTRPDFEEIRTYYSSDTRFDSILFGCLLALACNPARLPAGTPARQMRTKDWLLLGGGVLLLLAFTIAYRDPEFRESLRYTLQGIALLPLFYYAVRFPTTGPFRVFNTRVLARIGVLSYGIYLIHQVVLSAIPDRVRSNIPNAVYLVLGLIIAVGFAALLDRYVDPYFRRRRAALH